jgi:hypothetical protein
VDGVVCVCLQLRKLYLEAEQGSAASDQECNAQEECKTVPLMPLALMPLASTSHAADDLAGAGSSKRPRPRTC